MFKPIYPIHPHTSKLSTDEALSLINELLSKRLFHFSDHVTKRITQPDRNFNIDKLVSILTNPKTVSSPKWNNKYKNYGYVITGYNKRHVVVSFKTDKNHNTYLELVTVY